MPNNPTSSTSATSGPNSDLGKGAAAGLLITNIAELTPLDEFGPSPQRGGLKHLKSIRNAAIHVVDGRIRDFGPAERVAAGLPKGASPRVLDASGGAVVPGFVDCHTHLLYSGSRADEYPMRVAGASYVEISSRGGGVTRTIRESSDATSSELKQALTARLAKALLNGTTTAEIKTGYWVAPEGECAALDIIAEVSASQPVDLVQTFHVALGMPARFGGAGEYARYVIDHVLPAVAPYARFCDVVCDVGAFADNEARQILQAAGRRGLNFKVHADEFSAAGGAELAAELGAVSADHLCFLGKDTVLTLAKAQTVAVLLPATCHYLLAPRFADARQLIDGGVPIALGTDHGPGSPTLSMPFVMGLACSWLRMDPAEALVAATWNAACAIGCASTAGQIAVGRPADLVVLEAPTYRDLPYLIDQNLVRYTLKDGAVFGKHIN